MVPRTTTSATTTISKSASSTSHSRSVKTSATVDSSKARSTKRTKIVNSISSQSQKLPSLSNAKKSRTTSKTPELSLPYVKSPTPKKPASRPVKASPENVKRKVPPSQSLAAPSNAVLPPPKKIKSIPGKLHINQRPDCKLKVFVFGEGSAGELGLGAGNGVVDVKRPRLNPLLLPDKVGVVSIATGGMHNIALTHDNKILTWGVNDQGALGRDTTWDGGLRDANADSEDDDDSSTSGLNPFESTPTPISNSHFPDDVVFSQVAAGDSCSFVLTDDGSVYGWGTFRSNEGILGFGFTGPKSREISMVQKVPIRIPELKNVIQIACGANHALALTTGGTVYAWGSGQQNQLGRRIIERRIHDGLIPREVGGLPRKRIKYISCGAYHSFALDDQDNVWAWGLNSFGEAGIPNGAGDTEAVVERPYLVKSLCGLGIRVISGGSHHSAAVTKDGKCLVWGRIDGGQLGIKLTEELISDPEAVISTVSSNDKIVPRILLRPLPLPGLDVDFVACGPEHTIAISKEGKAYSWGFNANYQLGQGSTDDISQATLIDNTAVRNEKLNWCGAGGQFSIITAPS